MAVPHPDPISRTVFRSVPARRFLHLRRLTDQVGVWEHARYTVPRREHGYCTDDNARALIVMCREPHLDHANARLAGTYLGFLRDAALPGGGFHNRRHQDGAWSDEVGSDDSQGRSIWALGTAVRAAPGSSMRRESLRVLDRQLGFGSPHLRPNAFAALGMAELLAAKPDHGPGRDALSRWASRIQPASDPSWPWPEPRLTYENARLPEALLAAGSTLGEEELVDSGLRLLEWLVGVETSEAGHFSFTPSGGWGPDDPRPGFDQQPVEAGAMADACARAWDLTGDGPWRELVLRAARWLIEANDGGVTLYDFHTGGCCDGLTRSGPNLNQGAESTLAALSVLQQADRVGRSEPATPVWTIPGAPARAE